MGSPTQKPKVAFFCINEHGQSNVVLSIASALHQRNEVSVHIISSPLLEARVAAIQTLAEDKTLEPIHFHCFPFPTIFEAIEAETGLARQTLPSAPGWAGMPFFRKYAPNILAPYTAEHTVAMFEWCCDFWDRERPDLCVVEPYALGAHDMCRTLGRRYLAISPCSLANALAMREPWGRGFWKYPSSMSGLTYPLRWRDVPLSIMCTLNTIYTIVMGKKLKAVHKARADHGIVGLLSNITPWTPDVIHICPSLPQIDLPLSKIPENLFNVGPITLPGKSVQELDPDLYDWLSRADTVLVNMGSVMTASGEFARQQAIGIRLLLKARKDVQVLWKLKRSKSGYSDTEGSSARNSDTIDDILGEELKRGRVIIRSWLDPEPIEILKTGFIVASVHHGGANSYFESCWTGTPQVILAQWFDTYDYATRAEYLQIGVYGNKSCAPNIDANEFLDALLSVLSSEEGRSAISLQASKLGRICQKSGGREEAADIITREALRR